MKKKIKLKCIVCNETYYVHKEKLGDLLPEGIASRELFPMKCYICAADDYAFFLKVVK